MASIPLKASLQELCSNGFERIRSAYESSGNGESAAYSRANVVDKVAQELYNAHISVQEETENDLCVVALGGYGRQELFPHSDVDLLFLSTSNSTLSRYREPIGRFVRSLWDLHLRASQTCRTLDDCSVLHRDNLEFNVALVDQRYVAGSATLFSELRNTRMPRLMGKEGKTLLNDLIEMSRQRHHKYWDTIFHLEPNLKEAPGGIRDFHVARWLSLISELESTGRWKSNSEMFPARSKDTASHAFRFLAAVRCFLHYQQDRDDNRLSYELQEKAADLGIGVHFGQHFSAAEWMRAYFRHARSVDRLAEEMIGETQPGRLALYDLYRDWRSRVSNLDFSAVRGKIYLKLPAAARDISYLMRLFEFVARHGLDLSREAERWVEQSLAGHMGKAEDDRDFWQHFCQILSLPHTVKALRIMHRLGWLEEFFPEFRAIDALVIRDFYHRYTVDEHSLLTIQNLYALRETEGEWDGKFSEILSEVAKPYILAFSLLFHDVGKGMAVEKHIDGSLQAVDGIFGRLRIPKEDSQTIRFLIRNHLKMSVSFQHRDIFDPATIHQLMDVVGSAERLKMLCLLTYADIKSVNPEALTPWKAEMLWTLYAATSNALARSVDSDRIQSIEMAVSISGDLAEGNQKLPERVDGFLEGLPKRYLRIHTAEEIEAHHRMAQALSDRPVQTELQDHKHYWELMVITKDRPRLFSSLAGALTAWGMNIVGAEAFSNDAGIVLDTFRFVDLFRTLDLNPAERDRLKQTIEDVLTERKLLEDLMKGRIHMERPSRTGPKIPTRVRFDNESSFHSTLLELSAADRPGLLYQISSLLVAHRCNIEVAMIDTQGRKAIDVFYLTIDGRKLGSDREQTIKEALLTSVK